MSRLTMRESQPFDTVIVLVLELLDEVPSFAEVLNEVHHARARECQAGVVPG